MKKLTKKDIYNKQQAYLQKYIEYSKLSLEQLKELYPKLKGTYKLACVEVTKEKLNKQKLEGINENNIKKDIEDEESN